MQPSINPAAMELVFPFHFAVNDALELIRVGGSLSKLIPDLQSGDPLSKHLQLVTPKLPVNFHQLRQYLDNSFVFRSLDGRFRLRGQLIEQGHSSRAGLLFVGDPIVENLAMIHELGLKMSDFSLHNNSTDLLLLLQAQTAMMQDLRQLAKSHEAEIDRRRVIETELREAVDKAEAASRAKADFLAIMSHEIRTPLNAVLGVLSLLSDDVSKPPRREYLQTATEAASSLLELVSNILDYSQMNSGELEHEVCEFSPAALLQSVRSLHQTKAQAKGQRIILNSSLESQSKLLGDADRIRQVLSHLVDNAIKYSDRGNIGIDCETSSIPDNGQRSQRLRLAVTDNGPGIPADRRKELFKEFSMLDASYSRVAEGTGLGLALCKQVVEMMDGKIGFDSTEGQGSCFWIELILSEAAPATRNEQRAPQKQRRENTSPEILLVEDVPANRLVIKELLSRAGYLVDTVSDGYQAIEAVNSKVYDMILMDISLPGMDGLQTTQAIRDLSAASARTPVIAMTAHAMRGDKEKFLNAGMDDYLPKPVVREQLIDMIRQWTEPMPNAPKPDNSGLPDADKQPDDSVDIALLEQLGRDTDPEMVPQLLAVFLEDAYHRIDLISSAIATDNYPEIAAQTHALGSSAATFGLPGIFNLARECEQAVRETNHGAGKRLAEALVVESPPALDALNRYAQTL